VNQGLDAIFLSRLVPASQRIVSNLQFFSKVVCIDDWISDNAAFCRRTEPTGVSWIWAS